MKRRIVKTEAVVLKRMDYLESSRIVTLFTEEEGKISVLAKGARAKNNRFGSSLEPGTVVQVVYYTRPSRELQTLTQADIVERSRKMTESMATLTTALHMLDLAHAVTDTGHRHPEVYRLLVEALRAVGAGQGRLPAILLGYRLKLIHLSGLSPGLHECVRCGRVLVVSGERAQVAFDVRAGGVLCSSCAAGAGDDRMEHPAAGGGRIRLWNDRITVLRSLLESDIGAYSDDLVPAGYWNELDGVLRSYERYHLLHSRTLKTESMVREFIV